MNKNIGLIIGGVVLVLIAGGIYTSSSTRDTTMDINTEGSTPPETAVADVMKKDVPTTPKEDIMMKNTETAADPAPMEAKPSATTEMVKSGSYEAYAPEKIARAETGDVVLFFHASWCPSCRGLNTDIEKNASTIPSGLSILKVNYDTETALKQKYGITTQHTLVQVDADRNLITKWSGSPSLGNVVSKVQ